MKDHVMLLVKIREFEFKSPICDLELCSMSHTFSSATCETTAGNQLIYSVPQSTFCPSLLTLCIIDLTIVCNEKKLFTFAEDTTVTDAGSKKIASTCGR